ncbi:aromatic ring-hydroxylating oxygenase subunit alpha [Halioxenophilus aromaticivorans]|uniref:Aromatic ring-hydroxylating dioxygenase subunit alpha n=1 Tax=Halioxenophilus aromaticivorans TaxID=1306992 RepID=A0AAV3U6Q6_9ALTE
MSIQENYNRIITRMIEHVDDGTTDQADSTMQVPVDSYLNEDQYQREMELIFRRKPVLIGLSHELPKPGDYKTITFLDKPLLVVRQRDGSAKVMLNVCPHRGMKIATEDCGHKAVFSCPYHGWSFSGDGSLRGVADREKFGEVDKTDLGLTQLPTYERAGLIFAVLTPGLEVDFEAFLGGMIEDVELLDFANYTYYGQRDMHGANWKVAYDGYLEGYHFAAAHPDTIFPRTFSNIMEFDCYGPHILIGFPQRCIGQLKEVPESERHKHENQGYDFIRTFFPNVSIFVAPELTQIAQIIPGPTPAENRTVVYYLNKDNIEGEAREELIKTIDWIWKVVEEEDYGLGLKVQQGLESGAIKNVVFGRNERGNQYFHNWVNYLLADDPTTEPPVM